MSVLGAVFAAPPETVSEVLEFHLHLDVLGVIAALIVLYEYGLRRLAVDHAPRGEVVVTRNQRIAF